MPFNYEQIGGRIPIDPRLVEKIRRSPAARAEQGEGWLSAWGGPDTYRIMASLIEPHRLTYAAILEGHATPEEISAVTGLDTKEVNAAINSLAKKGLVSLG